jgi:hypothetical protein
MEKLIEFLKEFENFIKKYHAKYDESLKKYRLMLQTGEELKIKEALSELDVYAFGGMGSLQDLQISKESGHLIEEKDEKKVNNLLEKNVKNLQGLLVAVSGPRPKRKIIVRSENRIIIE